MAGLEQRLERGARRVNKVNSLCQTDCHVRLEVRIRGIEVTARRGAAAKARIVRYDDIVTKQINPLIVAIDDMADWIGIPMEV